MEYLDANAGGNADANHPQRNSTTSGGAPAMRLTIAYPQAGDTETLTKIIPILRKAPAPMARVAAPGIYADPNSTPTP